MKFFLCFSHLFSLRELDKYLRKIKTFRSLMDKLMKIMSPDFTMFSQYIFRKQNNFKGKLNTTA